MSEAPDPGAPVAAPPSPPVKPECDAQLIVSLSIVAAMFGIGVGLMITAYCLSNWTIASSGVGMIVGSLATALNAPTGIASALRAASKPPGA